MVSNSSNDIIGMLERFFAKAPHMSKNARDTLVKIAPWIAVIFGILGILGGLAGLGALTTAASGFIVYLFWLAYSVLLLAAFPGLKAKKANGWKLLFWSEAVSVIGSIVELQFFSAVIVALIGFYLLFEVKSYYK